MFESKAHVGVGSEMKHRVTAGHGLRERWQVEIVAADKSEVRILLCGCDKFLLAGGKIIPSHHGKTIPQQYVSEAAANESRHACNENSFHAVAGKLNRSQPLWQALRV